MMTSDELAAWEKRYNEALAQIAALKVENARLRGPWKYDPASNTYTANATKEPTT